jgi:hypothetical protein
LLGLKARLIIGSKVRSMKVEIDVSLIVSTLEPQFGMLITTRISDPTSKTNSYQR